MVFFDVVSRSLADAGIEQSFIVCSRVQVDWHPERTIYRVKPFFRHMRADRGLQISDASEGPCRSATRGREQPGGAQGRAG